MLEVVLCGNNFMKNEAARNGMARAGFHAVTSPAEAVAPPKLPVPNGYPIFVMH